MSSEFGAIVGGQQERTGRWLEVRSPWSGEVVGRVARLGIERVAEVLEMTHATRIELTRRQRADVLDAMATAVSSRRDEVSRLITDESGLCLTDSRYEAGRVCDVLRFAAIRALEDDSEVFPCDISEHGRPRRIYTTRQPLRLVSAITPFNHPMNQVAHKVAPAIATNTPIVLKPSEKTPLSAYWLAQLALDCDLPPHAFNVVNGELREVGPQLVTHELVEMVTFTGSTKIGKQIAASAGYKRLLLELGGSSPLLILKDADVDEGVDVAMAGIFKNSGQRCTAIRRLLVHRSLASIFASSLADRVRTLRYGDPYDEDNDMGTVIDKESAIRIQAQVEDAVARGAEVLTGHHLEGALYAPTVVVGVDNDFPLVAQETFGPVAAIIPFEQLDDAIALANDTEYGLAAGVISDHWPSIQRCISEIDAGTVNVKEAPSYRLEWTPFGGIKASGLGYKEGVIETMNAMTWVKTYSLPWDNP
ncbi:MAG: aldehyde dehydrogenase family protein [Candidatus Latescibacterota bacterium]|nr:aldehyde dehydrogenase family protein [Candidatus Latescibacterota bacterium]